jgi:ABC-2 type transport system permease protein
VRANYLKFYSYVETNELNRRLLIGIVNQARDQAGPPLQGYADQMRAATDQYNQAVRSRNAAAAEQTLAAMQTTTVNDQTEVSTRLQLLKGAESYFKAPTSPNDDTDRRAGAINQSLANVLAIIANLQVTLPQQITSGQPDTKATNDLVTNAMNAENAAKTIQLPPADVLVAPFQAEVKNEARILPSFIAFYAPAVLALLLQHVSISLTALTLVRERTSGATELFRISPSAAPEIVFGKFLGYAFVAAFAGAVLAALMRFALNVPMFGSWWQFAGIIALLIGASLGFGLVVSALARTETQAVQYGMLILLASVFFGNFFLAVDTLYPWARYISYALPITYGVQALQDIMLRGQDANPHNFAALAAFMVGLFIIGTLLFRREIRRA